MPEGIRDTSHLVGRKFGLREKKKRIRKRLKELKLQLKGRFEK